MIKNRGRWCSVYSVCLIIIYVIFIEIIYNKKLEKSDMTCVYYQEIYEYLKLLLFMPIFHRIYR
jgi:hypothetical protein